MHIERHTLTLAVSAGGALTTYTPVVTGRVLSVVLTAGTLDAGTDVTITGEDTGQAILTLTNTNSGTFYPRNPVHGPTGTGLTYDGTRTVNEPAYVAGERIKVVVAQGGASTSGTLAIMVG